MTNKPLSTPDPERIRDKIPELEALVKKLESGDLTLSDVKLELEEDVGLGEYDIQTPEEMSEAIRLVIEEMRQAIEGL